MQEFFLTGMWRNRPFGMKLVLPVLLLAGSPFAQSGVVRLERTDADEVMRDRAMGQAERAGERAADARDRAEQARERAERAREKTGPRGHRGPSRPEERAEEAREVDESSRERAERAREDAAERA